MSRVYRRAGRPRSSTLDQRILAATRQALADGGYAAPSMEAVARSAGVVKQTLYRRWPRRPLLVIDAVLPAPGAARAGMPGAAPDTGTLAGDLAAILAEQTTADQAAGPELLRGLAADCLGDPGLTDVFRARLLRPPARGRPGRRAGVEGGELSPDVTPALVAEVVAGAMLTRLLLRGARGADDLAFGRRLAGLVTAGATRPS